MLVYILAPYLFTTFLVSAVANVMGFRATSKLAAWLKENHPKIWQELGCPRTWPKKEGSVSELQAMWRFMPLHNYSRELKGEVPQRLIEQNHKATVVGLISLLLFILGVVAGVVIDSMIA